MANDPTEFLSRTGYRRVRAVSAPASALTGSTLAANVVYSSLTSLGTIATGVWHGSVIGATYGGTGVANTGTLTFSGTASVTGANTGDQDLSSYAPLASPTFTGVPSAPTAALGTNTTQIATTAFVLANGGGGGSPALDFTNTFLLMGA